jgi:excisionase family DNA binding protein
MTVNELAIEVPNAQMSGESNASGWRSDSECRKHPTRWWFAGGHRETLQAKGICAECPVQGPCLEFALSRADLLGIWAGTTPNERTSMRRDRRTRVVDSAAAIEADEPSREVAPQAAPAEVERIEIDLVAEAGFEPNRQSERETKRQAVRRPGRGLGPVGAFVDGNDLLTPAEAAHKLGVTPNTVTRWSRAGKISAIQTMGGHRRFRRSEIERVMQAANLATATPI